MERKQLTASQRVAFQTFWSRFQQAQRELAGMVNTIAEEHDIPQGEFPLWRISTDGQWLERIKQGEPEKPQMKIPSGKRK